MNLIEQFDIQWLKRKGYKKTKKFIHNIKTDATFFTIIHTINIQHH